MAILRLDRILSDCGAASRSEAQRIIRQGSVSVNGITAKSGADKYDTESSVISVNGVPITYAEKHYIMMNKPAGVISATEDSREKTVTELLQKPYSRMGLFPAGRLDKDSVGLLILTDDGEYAHKIMSPAKKVCKTYYIETEGVLSRDDCKAFESGILLSGGYICKPAELTIISAGERSRAQVKIREGKYHQIKRMIAARGKRVVYLKRISIGGLELDSGLCEGEYREMTAEEQAAALFGGT